MRSDGRCGRDFGTDYVTETKCAKGMCCSSHGWCGFGEDYCSVALGCQSGCDPVDEAEQKRMDEQKGNGMGAGVPDDDDDYHSRMKHYRYDDDYRGDHHEHYGEHDYSADMHRRHHRGRYGQYDDLHDDYHHRYDDAIDNHGHYDDHYDGHGDDHGDSVDEEEDGGGVELVGLHEKVHLGEGDDIPLETSTAETPRSDAAAAM